MLARGMDSGDVLVRGMACGVSAAVPIKHLFYAVGGGGGGRMIQTTLDEEEVRKAERERSTAFERWADKVAGAVAERMTRFARGNAERMDNWNRQVVQSAMEKVVLMLRERIEARVRSKKEAK